MSKRAALLAGAKVIGFALTLPLPLVLVRLLNQSDFGLYKQVFQILSDALTLLGLHVSASAYYFMPRNPEKKSQVALNVLIFYGVVGSAAALVCAVYPRWVTLIFKTDDLVPYVPMLGLAVLLWLLSSLLEIVTVANSDIRSAALFTVLVQLSKGAMLLAGAAVTGTVRGLVLAAVSQGALQCVILFVYLRSRFGRFWQSFDASLFKAQLANALPFGLGALAYATQANLHNYFVSHYFEPAEFAVYAVGCFELPLLNLLVDSVISILIPEVAGREAQADYRGIVTLWASAVRKLAFFFIPAYTLAFVMRSELIAFLFTTNYEAAVPIFTINLLNILLYIAVPTSIMRAFDDLKYFRLRLSVAMLPLSCVALYAGIQLAGLAGAIAGFVLVQTIDLLIISAKAGRRLGIQLTDALLLAPVLRTIAAAAAAGLAAYAVRLALGAGVPLLAALVVCSFVFVLVHLIAAFALGAVTDEEKNDLRALISRLFRFGGSRAALTPAAEA